MSPPCSGVSLSLYLDPATAFASLALELERTDSEWKSIVAIKVVYV